MSIDRDRYEDRPLDWSGVITTLQSLEGETITLATEGSGDSSISVTGPLRLIDLRFPRCVGFAIAQAVVTLYAEDLAQARLRTLGDGHFIVHLQLGQGTLLLGDPDLLTVDYQENPFPDDPTAPRRDT